MKEDGNGGMRELTPQERDELRRAAIKAHERYSMEDQVQVADYDDEESFVEKVDGGFWVEAFVWVPEESL